MRSFVSFVIPHVSSNLGIHFQTVPMSQRSGRAGRAGRAGSAGRATRNGLFPTRINMIQPPEYEQPSRANSMYDHSRRRERNFGKPINFGAGRALQKDHGNDAIETCIASLSAARRGLRQEDIQLVHCTVSLDVDVGSVFQTLRKELNVPMLGRTVNKKDSPGCIEILVVSSEEGSGISFGSSSLEALDGEDNVLMTAAFLAGEKALDGLLSRESCEYMLFSHTPGDTGAVRSGLTKALPNVVAYGGPALGEHASGRGWTLFGDSSLQSEDLQSMSTVHVAAIPGSLAFLCSAVIRSWVQPVYSEALPFLEPTYMGNPDEDLLTAIRYNDWDKFVWCIEEQGVDVNTKWAKKQNQSPLIAACARARVEMVKYLLDRGADAGHRNDGGYTAMMYTRKLTEYDRDLVLRQLKMLADAGANMQLTNQERERILKVSSGGIVE